MTSGKEKPVSTETGRCSRAVANTSVIGLTKEESARYEYLGAMWDLQEVQTFLRNKIRMFRESNKFPEISKKYLPVYDNLLRIVNRAGTTLEKAAHLAHLSYLERKKKVQEGNSMKLTKAQVGLLQEAKAIIQKVFQEAMEKEFPVGMKFCSQDFPERRIYKITGHQPIFRVTINEEGKMSTHFDHSRIQYRKLDKLGRRYGGTQTYSMHVFWMAFKKVV